MQCASCNPSQIYIFNHQNQSQNQNRSHLKSNQFDFDIVDNCTMFKFQNQNSALSLVPVGDPEINETYK